MVRRFSLDCFKPKLKPKLKPISTMAKDQFLTPVGEFRYFRLLGEPRRNDMDTEKPDYWSTDFVLSAADPSADEFIQMLTEQLEALHGTKKKRHKHAFPWKTAEDEPVYIFKFKLNQYERRDGTLSSGPRVVDAKKHAWPEDKWVGNGSKGRILFTIYDWDNATSGCGITLQPSAAQILNLVPYNPPNPADAFEEVEDGFDVTEDFGEDDLFEETEDIA